MTTAFQTVFDRAESINFSCRPVVAQTISRSNVIRTVSRGGQVWRIEAKLPDGMPWSTLRSTIQDMETANRFTPATIQINNSGYNDWLTPYQGDSANSTGFQAVWTKSEVNITLTTSPTTTSGYKFRAGDLIQLESSGHVYAVAYDVPWNANTVTLNRPIIDDNGSGTLYVGPAVTWTVYCADFPTWNIFGRNQVSWSGSFVFYEVLS